MKWVVAAVGLMFANLLHAADAPNLANQREELFKQLKSRAGYSDAQMKALSAIFAGSNYMGQGNPKVTKHPMTEQECTDIRTKAGAKNENPQFEKICGGKYMAPLYDASKGEKPENAKACIDQYEFPNLPCAYPVVWTKAKEAEEVCQSLGKRMCDAHEWEGACAGSLLPPDYPFKEVEKLGMNAAVNKMRAIHNGKWDKEKTWSYGKERKTGNCGMNSSKDAKCNGGNWENCGSNTYPTGAFPNCKSSLEVYDIHGNAAEHMNLPLNEKQMTSKGSRELGVTEMKGSWFIFDKYQAHPDQCRWRAPFWHGTKVMDDHSHHNYHLGFRCCKTL